MAESLTLYGTSACHLCELAEELLTDLQQRGADFSVTKVDIAEDDALMEQYGIVIPVVRRSNGTELGWPFSAEDLMRWLLS